MCDSLYEDPGVRYTIASLMVRELVRQNGQQIIRQVLVGAREKVTLRLLSSIVLRWNPRGFFVLSLNSSGPWIAKVSSQAATALVH